MYDCLFRCEKMIKEETFQLPHLGNKGELEQNRLLLEVWGNERGTVVPLNLNLTGKKTPTDKVEVPLEEKNP